MALTAQTAKRTRRKELEGKMDTSEQIKPIRKYNRLAIVSFVLGLMTIIFPIISILYLIAVNGGPGYLQSLFCGIPVAFVSIITGIVSLVQIRRKNQKGDWMATLGIVFGNLFYVILCIMVFVLISPFLFGTAH
jgi:uncharacterized membrane protein HdeD (DUF308 family)